MNLEELNADWHKLIVDGKPTEEFWELWREKKDELKALGVNVKKSKEVDAEGRPIWSVTVGKPKPTQADRLRALPPLPTLRDFTAVPKGARAAFFAALDPALCKAAGLTYIPETVHNYPAKQSVTFWKGTPFTMQGLTRKDWSYETVSLQPGEAIPDRPADPDMPEGMKETHGKLNEYPAHSWASGDVFNLAGISDFGLAKSTALSKRLAKDMAAGLSTLQTPAVVTSARSCDSWAKNFWNPLLDLPLNEVKAAVIEKTRAGLARYFSPEERSRRAEAEDRNEELRVWASEGYKPSRAPLFVNLP